MAARELAGRLARYAHEWPLPGEGAQHVGAGRVHGEVAARVAKDELDLFRQRPRLHLRLRHRRVGRADERAAVPGDDEEDAAVVGVRDHDRGFAGEELVVEHEVHALRGLHRRERVRVVEPADTIGEDSRGVHDGTGFDRVVLAGLEVAEGDTGDDAATPGEPRDARIVEDARAQVGGRLRERHRHPCVVELAVEVHDSAEELVPLDVGDAGDRLLAAEDTRGREIQLPGQQVVRLQADAVERSLPPAIPGDDERQVAGDVRGVGVEQPPLVEGLHHEAEVALLEVPDAAVHELRAPAGGRRSEVGLLEEQRPVTAALRVDRDTQAGRPAADDHDVPGPRRAEPAEHVLAFHGSQ